MKLINVISDSNIGGAGIVLINYLKLADREKYDHLVIVPENSKLIEPLKEINIPYREVSGMSDKSFSFEGVKELRKIFKEEKPDIIHAHSVLAARVAAKIYGKCKIVHTRHSVFDQSSINKSLPMRIVKGGANNFFSDVIIAVSPAAKDNIVEIGTDPDKVEIVFNGVEQVKKLDDNEKKVVREGYGLSDTDFVCAIIARLVPVKGHKTILDAAKMIMDKGYSDIKIVIAGSGEIENELKQYANDLGLNNCIFAGFVTDVYKLENIMDIQLNASYGTEATSASLLEGMSLGVPAVVSDFGGNPYVIDNGKNGLVVEKQNPKALFDGIIKVYEDKELYQSMSKNSVEIFNEKFTLNAMVSNTEKVYDRLLERE